MIRVVLPDLYRNIAGKLKKQYAWTYLKEVHPEYDPLPDQPELETNNTLLCTYNYEKSRQLVAEVNGRRNERKKSKKKKR